MTMTIQILVKERDHEKVIVKLQMIKRWVTMQVRGVMQRGVNRYVSNDF